METKKTPLKSDYQNRCLKLNLEFQEKDTIFVLKSKIQTKMESLGTWDNDYFIDKLVIPPTPVKVEAKKEIKIEEVVEIEVQKINVDTYCNMKGIATHQRFFLKKMYKKQMKTVEDWNAISTLHNLK